MDTIVSLSVSIKLDSGMWITDCVLDIKHGIGFKMRTTAIVLTSRSFARKVPTNGDARGYDDCILGFCSRPNALGFPPSNAFLLRLESY